MITVVLVPNIIHYYIHDRKKSLKKICLVECYSVNILYGSEGVNGSTCTLRVRLEPTPLVDNERPGVTSGLDSLTLLVRADPFAPFTAQAALAWVCPPFA